MNERYLQDHACVSDLTIIGASRVIRGASCVIGGASRVMPLQSRVMPVESHVMPVTSPGPGGFSADLRLCLLFADAHIHPDGATREAEALAELALDEAAVARLQE